MKRFNLFTFVCGLMVTTAFAQDKQSEPKVLELPRIHVVPITDTENDRQYDLYIKLPESYSDTTRHPVIYYTDAMWHVEMLSGSAEYIMEDAILAGISWQTDNNETLMQEVGPHVSRYRDYSMSESSNQEYQTKYHFGQADKHLAFIRNDVIGYMETNYRTDPENRTYFGYSMGGEFGTYILLSQPDTFNNYILGSPSLRTGDIPDLEDLNSKATINLNANVFIAYGSEEERSGPVIEELITMLRNRNDQSLNLNPVVLEGSHQTAFPMTALRGVRWVSKLMKKN